MNEEMNSNPGKSAPTVVAISKDKNSEGLSQLPQGILTGPSGKGEGSETIRKHVVSPW